MDQVTRAELIAQGVTDRQIRAAVDAGRLVRLRRGRFARPDLNTPTRRAVMAGGRLTCVSELRHRGIWVLDSNVIHVQVGDHASRLGAVAGIRVHWRPRIEGRLVHVDLIEALVVATGCLDHRAWIASVDSALHLGRLHPVDLPSLRRHLPASRRRFVDLVDRRAESGLESIVRVIAVELGFRVRTQVQVDGVGRVDLVIEDWVVVETDGSAFHDVALSPRDRRRDAVLAASGRSVLRPGYSLVVHDQPTVARQLIGAVAVHRRVKNSGERAARARSRLGRLGFS